MAQVPVYQAATMHIIGINKVAIYLPIFFMKRYSHAGMLFVFVNAYHLSV